ncbi:septum formation family protein [Catellatospora sp. KI3]|uniref:septum formation family protein n=1 Tax=Catellatospora sp. KI3 TaxID=3041620 RepID=UPI002483021B|nr:septum formation family protein [Catellatospora sp. KI3]MDI1465106.1 septum formation family protein [Catellatospora sp. KI3]
MSMRRWIAAGTAMCALLAPALAGCSASVAGTDGKLTDDWSALPEAQVFTPGAEVCHPKTYEQTGRATAYQPVDCTQPHFGETVYVGTLTGAATELAAPPEPNTAAVAAAYAECDERATAYVGRQWRDGRLTLDLTLPSAAAWQGGARWYRCELNELTTVTGDADWVERKSSLRGDLAGDVLLGCFVETGTSGVDKMEAADCAKSHNAEYVGSFAATRSRAYPAADKDWDYFHDNCRKVIATYVGITQSATTRYGVISWPYSRATWAGGDRGVRCYLWLEQKKMTGSAKDTKGKGIPS